MASVKKGKPELRKKGACSVQRGWVSRHLTRVWLASCAAGGYYSRPSDALAFPHHFPRTFLLAAVQ